MSWIPLKFEGNFGWTIRVGRHLRWLNGYIEEFLQSIWLEIQQLWMRETHIRQWTSWRCFLHVAPLIRMSRGEMQMARPVLCTWHLLRVETSKIRKFCSFWDWQNPQENTLHSQVEDILWWDSFRCNYDEYIVHSHVHIYATGCYDLSLLAGLFKWGFWNHWMVLRWKTWGYLWAVEVISD